MRIALVDRRYLIRSAFEAMLKGMGHRVFAVGTTVDDVMPVLSSDKCDVLIVHQVYSAETYQLFSLLRTRYPELKIIYLCGTNAENAVKRLETLGLRGFINEYADPNELAVAMAGDIQHRSYICVNLLSRLTFATGKNLLSKREMEVVKTLASGLNNNQTAAKLNAHPSTISTYKRRIYKKLQINSVSELMRWAINNGLDHEISQEMSASR